MNTEKQEVYPNFLARPAVGVEKRTFTPSRGALPKWLASIADKALEKMRTMSEEERRLWDMNVSLKQENRRLVAENEGLKKRTEEQATDLAVKAPYAKSFRRLFLSLNKRDNARLARLFKTSLDGRHIFEDAPLFFEAIAEDLVATAEARTKDHARDIANGTRGGNTKAENARRKAATKREYLTEKNAPRRAALEAFRATSPHCTLPEAASELSEAIDGLSVDAAKKWLRRMVEAKAIHSFAAGQRGRPRAGK